MGLSQTSVLAFVIDTTGSMSDDIEEAKRVSFSIIDSRRGKPEEPSEYILVPFNDPGNHIVYLVLWKFRLLLLLFYQEKQRKQHLLKTFGCNSVKIKQII